MPPKKAGLTRTIIESGTIGQLCTKCHTWKAQEEHFKSKTGANYTLICQKCRDDASAAKALRVSKVAPQGNSGQAESSAMGASRGESVSWNLLYSDTICSSHLAQTPNTT